MPTLIFTIGIPGSGKSRWVKTYLEEGEDTVHVVSPDDIRRAVLGDVSNQEQGDRIWQIALVDTVKLLLADSDVILDATNVSARSRGNFLDQVKSAVVNSSMWFNTRAVVFPCDPEIAKERIAKDMAKGLDRSNVPPDVIDKMYSRFVSGYERIWEQFDEVHIVDGSTVLEMS